MISHPLGQVQYDDQTQRAYVGLEGAMATGANSLSLLSSRSVKGKADETPDQGGGCPQGPPCTKRGGVSSVTR